MVSESKFSISGVKYVLKKYYEKRFQCSLNVFENQKIIASLFLLSQIGEKKIEISNYLLFSQVPTRKSTGPIINECHHFAWQIVNRNFHALNINNAVCRCEQILKAHQPTLLFIVHVPYTILDIA